MQERTSERVGHTERLLNFAVNVVFEFGSVFDGESSKFPSVMVVTTGRPIAVSAVVPLDLAHRIMFSRAHFIGVEVASAVSLYRS